MAPRSLKTSLLAGLVAYLAGVLPLAAAARSPAGFAAEKRAGERLGARTASPCDTVKCGWGQVCQPSVDGEKATCVDVPPEGLCGTIACPPGTECCNRLLSICIKPGGACPRGVEAVERREPPNLEARTSCRGTKCPPGTECCNPLLGICRKPGTPCPRAASETVESRESREKCGPVLCKTGTKCCNASCGICVKPGGSCTQQICDDKQVQ